MAGLEILAVVGCVAAVVSAYNDGSDLVKKVRERRRQRKALQGSTTPDTSTQDLETSLVGGKVLVRQEYDRRYRRHGNAFANGDQEARDVLKDIIIHLQGQVISNLKVAWQEDVNVDVLSLQDVSDDSQSRAILCLMQLHQRLLVAEPLTGMSYYIGCSPPISKYNNNINSGHAQGFIEPPSRVESWTTQASLSSPSRSSTATSTLEIEPRKTGRLSGMFRKQKAIAEDSQHHIAELPDEVNKLDPPPVPLKDDRRNGGPMMMGLALNILPHEEPPFSRSRVSSISTRRSSFGEADQRDTDPFYDPWKETSSPREDKDELHMFRQRSDRYNGTPLTPNTVPDPLFSQTSKRTKGMPLTPDTIPDHSSSFGNSLVSHRSSQSSGHSWISRISRDKPSDHRNSQASTYSWRPPTIPETTPDRRSSQSSVGHASVSQASGGHTLIHAQQSPLLAKQTILPNPTANIRGHLPSEDNDFAGFCKGAWRLQIGERRKAFCEVKRPGGMYVIMSSFWRCQKCHFEGRTQADPTDKTKKSIDTRVYGTTGAAAGILYRWEFLFKCHVHLKDAVPTTDSTFGCIFCCAEGRGTPLFGTVKGFLEHVQEHRPGVEGIHGGSRVPRGEVLYRVSCVLGRRPGFEEEFDIALPNV